MPARSRHGRTLGTTPEKIGRSLSRATARIDRLNQQRAELARELQDVIAAAQGMLADLGDTAVTARRQARRKVRKLKRRKRQVSKAARAKMAAAARRRWAKVRKAKR